jgi:hypothetical protein
MEYQTSHLDCGVGFGWGMERSFETNSSPTRNPRRRYSEAGSSGESHNSAGTQRAGTKQMMTTVIGKSLTAFATAS